jgi:uncharacterized Zn finger protein (UPF0148 family)
MTDRACDSCATPLMCSPRNQEPVKIVCVTCGEQRKAGPSSKLAQSRESASSILSTESLASEALSVEEVSTPATNLSADFPTPELPLLDTEEITRRRAQSDRASAEIGRLLLQGWTMLADECPRPSCYGVPLMRPPRSRDGIISRTRVRSLTKFFVSQSVYEFSK